jgi:succinate dehydrogenase / fumarate reductase flavoprotein subunit
VCNQKLGINGENKVYLDLSHIPAQELDVKLGGIMEIYEKFMGDDPRKIPMKIFPGVHYSMGGLWVDFHQKTSIPGMFAAGECDYSQHGANRLGANSLLSAVYGGMVAGPEAVNYILAQNRSAQEIPSSIFERQVTADEENYQAILKMDGSENAFSLHKELGEMMTDNVTVVRENKKLKMTYEKLQEFSERYQRINIEDTAKWSNTSASFVRQLEGMIQLAKVITLGAYARNESRGAHYKPEFPERNDEEWLKTTMAKYNESKNAPELSYEEVDISLIEPRKRDYTKAKGAK